MSHIICGRFLIKVGLIAIYNCSVILNEPKQFNEQSYDAHHVTIVYSSLYEKLLYEKPRKCRKNYEYSSVFENISAFFGTIKCVLSYEALKNI